MPLPRVTLPPVVPPPDREKIVSLKLLRFSVAPATLAKETAELELMAFAAPSWNVPPRMLIVPLPAFRLLTVTVLSAFRTCLLLLAEVLVVRVVEFNWVQLVAQHEFLCCRR